MLALFLSLSVFCTFRTEDRAPVLFCSAKDRARRSITSLLNNVRKLFERFLRGALPAAWKPDFVAKPIAPSTRNGKYQEIDILSWIYLYLLLFSVQVEYEVFFASVANINFRYDDRWKFAITRTFKFSSLFFFIWLFEIFECFIQFILVVYAIGEQIKMAIASQLWCWQRFNAENDQ